MSPQQRYAAVRQTDAVFDIALTGQSQVNQHDEDQDDALTSAQSHQQTPHSPPPSFRSRNSSFASRRLLREDPLENDADHTLADAFDDGAESETENAQDDRQRLMRPVAARSTSHSQPAALLTPVTSTTTAGSTQPPIERRVTELPAFTQRPTATRSPAGPRPTNDGVFANLSAKPTAGETLDDKPPTYEQAAADATPPYWETTILAPGMSSDDVYINGLPVGSVFSFIWNGMISMSFLFPGFLLTYLLHTTHAAKNGSLAGLGLTLVQYGFYMRGGKEPGQDANPGQFAGTPHDPNSHDFDPNNAAGTNGGNASNGNEFQSTDFISYGLMIIGWFILIRAVSGFLRARREEQLVLQSPARGLNVPVVADGEGERAV